MIEFWSVKFTPDQRVIRKTRTHPCRRARTYLRNGPLELILRFREGPAIRPNIWAKNRNFCIFHFFQKNEIFRKCFAKISVTKFRERKIWDCYLLRFSALFVVVYSVFSVDAFFTEKIAKQNRLFRLFWKKPKKGEKYGPKRGWKIEKRFFSSHPSSSAVRAGRFGPPNFFRRRPERRLISWSPNDRFWSFSINLLPKVYDKSPVRFSTNPLASLGGLNKT